MEGQCEERLDLDRMKKRKVSAFYTGLYLLTSVLFLAMIAFGMWFPTICVQEDSGRLHGWSLVGLIFFFVANLIGFCLSIYMVLKGTFSATYTVDAEGMTTYWKRSTYRLLWTDCVEFEIVQVPVNWSTSAAVVYCSTRVLSQKEKENFFWFHKNDFAHVQYFQYSDEAIFQEFLHCVPERARKYLEAEALVLGLPGE